MIKDWNRYFFVKDHRGSIFKVVDVETGAVHQELKYSEFGDVLQDTNPGFQPFGFAGGLYDWETKLVRFGARDYDGKIGRWLSKDPIRFDGGTPNLYEYVMNDPVNFVDPKGEILIPVFLLSWAAYETGFLMGSIYNKFFHKIDVSASYSDANIVKNIIENILPTSDLVSSPETFKVVDDKVNNRRIEKIDKAVGACP